MIPVIIVILVFLFCDLGRVRVALTCCCVLSVCRWQWVRSGPSVNSWAPVGLVIDKGFLSSRIVCMSQSEGRKGRNQFLLSWCTTPCRHTPRKSFLLSALDERWLSPRFLLTPAELWGRVWYDTMEGQHNHPHHLGDQNNPLCKLPGQEYQHDPQVSAYVSNLSPSVFSSLPLIKVYRFLSI